jgi:hypothetical protein
MPRRRGCGEAGSSAAAPDVPRQEDLRPPTFRILSDQDGVDQQGQRDRQDSAQRAQDRGPNDHGEEGECDREADGIPDEPGWITDWMTKFASE